MDYKEKYENALEKARKSHDKANGFIKKEWIETIFPELKESEDEKIREEIIKNIKQDIEIECTLSEDEGNRWIAWLEKQDPKKFEEELEKAYKFADEVQYRKGYEDAKHELEKQCNNNNVAKGILRSAAINLIVWIDYNKAEGNMCLSNMECEDIENALVSGNWDKIYAYMKKKLEKQGEQKPIPKYEIGDTIYYNSFGKIESMVVANIVDDGDGNPMYEDADGSSIFENHIIEQNPVWSKEDITNYSKVLFCLQTLTFPIDAERKELITWLKKQCKQSSADSYCKDNCKGFQETGKCFADGKCKAKRDAEQKSTEWRPYDKETLEKNQGTN